MDITLEQAMTALRNADKAGDNEAASRLADIVHQLMPVQGNAVPTDVAEHLASHANDIVTQPERSLISKGLDVLTQGATLGGEKHWDQNLFDQTSVKDINNPTTWEYTKALGNKALESSMAYAPMGELAETSALAPALLEKIPQGLETAAKIGDVASKTASTVGHYASPTINAVKNFLSPLSFMEHRTGVKPGTFKDVFEMGEKNYYPFSQEVKAFKQAQKEELPEGMSIGDYNYAISQGAPHDVAVLARHYAQDLENGAWYLKNLYYNNKDAIKKMGITAEEFAEQRANLLAKIGKDKIKSPEMETASSLGIRTGEYFPEGKKSLRNLAGQSGIFGSIGTLLGHAFMHSILGGAGGATIPLAMKSPKLNAELALRAGQISGLVKNLYKHAPESMIDTAVLGNYNPNSPTSVFNPNNQFDLPTQERAKGGLLKKFKKGGVVKLAGGGVSDAFDQAKQNVIDTYDTAKDVVANPTPYLNKFRQIGSSLNDPAEPISHYLHGYISGGIARANEAFMERSPEEIASGFAIPSGLGVVGSIESVGAKAAKPTAIELNEKLSQSNYKPHAPPAVDPSIGSLANSFDNALMHHNSLPFEEKVANSKRAEDALYKYFDDGVAKKVNTDLLSQNGKLIKTEKGAKGGEPIKLDDGSGVETTGLSLFPAYEQGKFNLCPNSASCKDSCLGKTADGNYRFSRPQQKMYNKTMALLNDPESFAIKLNDEIQSAKDDAKSNGNVLGVRLNTLSDIHPKVFESLMNAHPDVQFYDYTKLNANPLVPNHHITYSSTGIEQKAGYNGLDHDVPNIHQNWERMRSRLENGDNVAMAFSHTSELPSHIVDEETGNKYSVISGEQHDFRPLDMTPEGQKGVIVGLTKKAMNMGEMVAADKSKGFIVNYDPKYLREGNKPKGKLIRDENGNPIKTNHEVVIPTQPRLQSMRKVIPIQGQ